MRGDTNDFSALIQSESEQRIENETSEIEA